MLVEGVGSYGAELAKAGDTAGYEVVEAAHMSTKTRRSTGKTDPIDAFRIASVVLPLSTDRLSKPRGHHDRHRPFKLCHLPEKN